MIAPALACANSGDSWVAYRNGYPGTGGSPPSANFFDRVLSHRASLLLYYFITTLTTLINKIKGLIRTLTLPYHIITLP
jgi:hypothetical protein